MGAHVAHRGDRAVAAAARPAPLMRGLWLLTDLIGKGHVDHLPDLSWSLLANGAVIGVCGGVGQDPGTVLRAWEAWVSALGRPDSRGGHATAHEGVTELRATWLRKGARRDQLLIVEALVYAGEAGEDR